jgi:DNA topoisomerase-3
MKSLVLAEKPSVARELARVLGATTKQKNSFEGTKYVVTWALGHLVELAEPEDYDPKYKTWNLEDLPIIPAKMNLKVIRETSQQYKAIAQLCKRSDISELIIATDAGREGELVARWIMELVHFRKPFKRLWISSQTDKAIREGFSKLKPGRDYDRLYASAVCRAEADWLIGLNVTRALTSKYSAQLAAGRVQTPTLAMLMARDREIAEFRPVPYWTVSADFGDFTALWRKDDKHDGRLSTQAEAEALVSGLRGKAAVVDSVRTSERSEPQPLAYDLTELQRDANKKLGFSAKMTSNVLQKLYEQHKLVTYPRTDSRYLTSDMAPTFKSRLESIAVGPYAALAKPLLRKPLQVTKRIVDDSKVTDHHAIIPTEQYLQLGALSPDERKLYDLIVRRFIALFYGPSRYDETSLVIRVGDQRFYAKGYVQKDSGWKEVYGGIGQSVGSSQDDDEDDSISSDDADTAARKRSDAHMRSQSLPALKPGQALHAKNGRSVSYQTQPPAKYTEATLLSRMEKHGLGTPATRADIIEKLIHTETIERQQNRLVPTAKGKQLIELVAEDLRSPELTAKWERELERIAKGNGDPKAFLAGIRTQTAKFVSQVVASSKTYKPHNLTSSRCPECDKNLLEVKGKRGRMLVCPDRECGFRKATEPTLSGRRCPQCRKKMEIHDGKAGKYFQCRPCNFIEKLDPDAPRGGGKAARQQQAQMAKQFSDNVSLGSSLGDALKAAMEKKD